MSSLCLSFIRPYFSLPLSFFSILLIFFFFNDTATTEIYTLSLHDALPISMLGAALLCAFSCAFAQGFPSKPVRRSEEHTSELQSHVNLVCRLLLEKKKKLLQRHLTRQSPHYYSESEYVFYSSSDHYSHLVI